MRWPQAASGVRVRQWTISFANQCGDGVVDCGMQDHRGVDRLERMASGKQVTRDIRAPLPATGQQMPGERRRSWRARRQSCGRSIAKDVRQPREPPAPPGGVDSADQVVPSVEHRASASALTSALIWLRRQRRTLEISSPRANPSSGPSGSQIDLQKAGVGQCEDDALRPPNCASRSAAAVASETGSSLSRGPSPTFNVRHMPASYRAALP